LVHPGDAIGHTVVTLEGPIPLRSVAGYASTALVERTLSPISGVLQSDA
jgi:hypothetical protein